MVGFKLHFRVVVAEVISKLIDKRTSNMKLLVELINLLNPLLVRGICSCNLTELGTEVGQDVGENGYSKDDDGHCPEELKVVGWQDVSISDGSTSHSGPVHSSNILIKHSSVLKVISINPIFVMLDVSQTCCKPEATRYMEDESKNGKSLNKILYFNFEV